MKTRQKSRYFGDDETDLSDVLSDLSTPASETPEDPFPDSTPVDSSTSLDAEPTQAPTAVSEDFPGSSFTLADLTVTQQPFDNTPDPDSLAVLAKSALVLEQLKQQFGPLTIYSGFRSPLVNDAVHGSPTSDHAKGYAFDLAPQQTSIYAMFNALVNSGWKDNMREIFLKPSQGTLHLSFNVDAARGKVSVLDNETYRPLTQAETDYYLGPVIPTGPLIDDSAYQADVTSGEGDTADASFTAAASGPSPVLLLAGVAIVAYLIFSLTSKKGATA